MLVAVSPRKSAAGRIAPFRFRASVGEHGLAEKRLAADDGSYFLRKRVGRLKADKMPIAIKLPPCHLMLRIVKLHLS